MHGGLGGAMQVLVSGAHDPLVVRSTDDHQRLAVVRTQAFADFGFAATYDRFRLSLDFQAPLVGRGNDGTMGGYAFTAPVVDPGATPDTLSDARLGVDARLVGRAHDPFRLGVGAQLVVPNGNRSDDVTDHTYRAMLRVLFAGDFGRFAYAGHVGVHVRPLDDDPTPGSPRGHELLFGLAGGARLPLGARGDTRLVVGPELYGASAFRDLFASEQTAIEALFTGRIEGAADDGRQLRVKIGAGVGLNPRFGAAEQRFVIAIEIFDHHAP